jgi:methylamine dehydrogenase accessory protein MauD
MSGPWLASYIVLWGVVLFQGAVIFVLLRQLGLMYMGSAQGVARDGLAAGERAPEFTLPDLAGRLVPLADFRGRPLLLVFGSTTCAPCRGLIPDLNVFARERAAELQVLYLSRGEADETQRFVSELDVRVPVAIHPDHELPDKYKARVTPFAFVIDAEGVVRAKGLANNRDHLEQLLRMAKQESERGARRGRNGTRAAQPEAQEARP